ncbi:TM2 domain-containing protein [Burkholderiales bacterium JOSHI_001]|nr:TM2 domain-containing protein [Burkholderiales bacterium JOSHI_001]
MGLALMFGAVAAAVLAVGDELANRTTLSAGLLAQWAPWLAGATLVGGLGLWLLALGCGAIRPRRDERRRASLKWQWLVLLSCLPLAVLFPLADRPLEGVDRDLADTAFSLTVLALLLWLLHLVRRVLRHETETADERMQADPRPPVLYLRSFQDDDQALLFDGGFRLVGSAMRLLAVATPEQELAWLLNEHGPVVAIGKPDEPLPELGAARLYVSHADWQRVVLDLMQGAALVVLRVGNSPGVAWELEQALRTVPRQRVLLAVLGSTQLPPEVALPLQQALGGRLPATLCDPPLRGWRRWAGYRGTVRIGALVGFDAAGLACVEPVRAVPNTPGGWARLLVLSVLRPNAAVLGEAWQRLRPHLPNLPPRQARPSRAMAVTLAFLLGHFGAHWFYLGWRRRAWWHVALFPVALFAAWWSAGRMLWMDEPEFQRRFGGGAPTRPTQRAA